MKKLVTELVGWQEQRNLYPAKAAWMAMQKPGGTFDVLLASEALKEWQSFCGSADAGSLRGRPRYAGADLQARAASAGESLLPEDFRLQSDSPGHRAGKDGKDLGADVDLVGPGPAYERWKTTSDYQVWLKNTGQVKK